MQWLAYDLNMNVPDAGYAPAKGVDISRFAFHLFDEVTRFFMCPSREVIHLYNHDFGPQHVFLRISCKAYPLCS